jgi:hypothetical protein
VKDTPKGVWMLSFEEGGYFHLPIRCEQIARNGDLCLDCQLKQEKTAEKVRNITGTTIKGMLPSCLHGRVTEPIPFWTRLYDGEWFRLKIESGCTISETTMAKIKVAVDSAYEGVQTVPPEPMPGKSKKIRAKKGVVEPAPPQPAQPQPAQPPVKKAGRPKKVMAVPAEPAPVPVPVPVPVPAQPVPSVAQPLVKVKRAPKRINVASVKPTEPHAILQADTPSVPVENAYEIEVKKIEVDGRPLYYNYEKEKLYDLKFKYIGRLKDGKVASFPDSDADL